MIGAEYIGRSRRMRRLVGAVLLSSFTQGCVFGTGYSIDGSLVPGTKLDSYKAVVLEGSDCRSSLSAILREKGYSVAELVDAERFDVPKGEILKVSCVSGGPYDGVLYLRHGEVSCRATDFTSGALIYSARGKYSVGLMAGTDRQAIALEAVEGAFENLPNSEHAGTSVAELLQSMPTKASSRATAYGGTYHGILHYEVTGDCKGQPSGDYAMAVVVMLQNDALKAVVPTAYGLSGYSSDSLQFQNDSVSGGGESGILTGDALLMWTGKKNNYYNSSLHSVKSKIINKFSLNSISPNSAEFNGQSTLLDYGSAFLTEGGGLCQIVMKGILERNAEASTEETMINVFKADLDKRYKGKFYQTGLDL